MGHVREALAYFKSERVYQQLFWQMRKKYESIGRIGGTVSTKLFSMEELRVISAFFGMPVEKLAAKSSISIKAFEQQLQATRFDGISLKELLEAYFGEELISKKQIKLNRQAEIQEFINELKEKHTILKFWFDYLAKRNADSRWILRLAETDKKVFEDWTCKLALAISALPVVAERLPMFAQRITADPHAFDLNENLGKLLLHVLAVHSSKMEDGAIVMPTSTEDVNELLQEYHIYRDDLLNFVTCAGFWPRTQMVLYTRCGRRQQRRTLS
ncbi:TIGR02679 domain-containing protein [Virgibacillus sp. 179-BFC.A HS]|uniref:TIGR02679 domain-containing protein n=1 Tax=Tigheibacillus jepli TaxID=3035914 RepID=A0ABU5CFM3_9BACI|nr:TIGR02679 domain-containing protein [Virgibacillus sp. 179-BFC.A HS]MDY0405020.1 TIGR02679 domain-containing protein [Virgibacillus sp. 179-BFC.A HS]